MSKKSSIVASSPGIMRSSEVAPQATITSQKSMTEGTIPENALEVQEIPPAGSGSQRNSENLKTEEMDVSLLQRKSMSSQNVKTGVMNSQEEIS